MLYLFNNNNNDDNITTITTTTIRTLIENYKISSFNLCLQHSFYLLFNFIYNYINSLTLYDYLLIICILLFIIFIYKWILLPCNIIEDLTDVGYDGGIFNKNNKNYYKLNKNKVKRSFYLQQLSANRKIGSIPPVYPNGWYALLESTDLSKGQVQYVAALDENFAVIRDHNNKVTILNAYCPHLGANIAIGGVIRNTSTNNNCIECPFHGWRFDTTTGQCVSIPYTDKVPDKMNIKRWHCIEVNNLIYVWYHIDNIEPTYYIESNVNINSGSDGNAGWYYRGRNQLKVNCHIQEIPENGCDIAHLQSIHSLPVINGSKHLILPSTTNLTFNSLLSYILSYLIQHTWSAKWFKHPDPAKSHIAVILIEQDLKLFNKISLLPLNLIVHQIGPSYVELLIKNNLLGSILITQCILPEAPLIQKVIHHVYASKWYLAWFATLSLRGETIMFKRDVTIWNHKQYLNQPYLVKGDGPIMQYRRWYQQFFTTNSKTYQHIINNNNNNILDW